MHALLLIKLLGRPPRAFQGISVHTPMTEKFTLAITSENSTGQPVTA